MKEQKRCDDLDVRMKFPDFEWKSKVIEHFDSRLAVNMTKLDLVKAKL